MRCWCNARGYEREEIIHQVEDTIKRFKNLHPICYYASSGTHLFAIEWDGIKARQIIASDYGV